VASFEKMYDFKTAGKWQTRQFQARLLGSMVGASGLLDRPAGDDN
jgi:hypothetical protein